MLPDDLDANDFRVGSLRGSTHPSSIPSLSLVHFIPRKEVLSAAYLDSYRRDSSSTVPAESERAANFRQRLSFPPS